MVSEKRELEFNIAEISAAINDFLRRKSRHPERENIQNIELDAKENQVKVDLLRNSKIAHEIITATNLAAIVISYCKLMGIPIPHHAGKSIRVNSNNICLSVQYQYHPEPTHKHPAMVG